MSSVAHQAEPYGLIPVAQVVAWIGDMNAAAKAALGPSASTPASTRPRVLTASLGRAFPKVGELYLAAVDERNAIERDTRTRPEQLRLRWKEYGESFREQAAELDSSEHCERGTSSLTITSESGS